MLNDKGISLVETLLTLVILLTVFCSLIPLSYQMLSTLNNEKLELHASEVGNQAAKMVINASIYSGSETIEGIKYDWKYDGTQICIQYINLDEEREKCINPGE
ncbi:hypothetical protein ACIQ34_14845 [Ureibacillus sp. NPDC094379]